MATSYARRIIYSPSQIIERDIKSISERNGPRHSGFHFAFFIKLIGTQGDTDSIRQILLPQFFGKTLFFQAFRKC